MSRSLKVCLVSPYDFVHPGGVSEHVRHLGEELRERSEQAAGAALIVVALVLLALKLLKI